MRLTIVAVASLAGVCCVPRTRYETTYTAIDTVRLEMPSLHPAIEWLSDSVRYAVTERAFTDFLLHRLSIEQRPWRRDYLEYIGSEIDRRLAADTTASLAPFQHFVVDLMQAGLGSLTRRHDTAPVSRVIVTAFTTCGGGGCLVGRTVEIPDGPMILSVVDTWY